MSTSSRTGESLLHRRSVRVLAAAAVIAAPLAALPLLATSASARPTAAACVDGRSIYPHVVAFDGPSATATIFLNAKAPTCETFSLILYKTPGVNAAGNAKYPQEAVSFKTVELQPGQTETISLSKGGQVCFSELDLVFGSHIETPLMNAYYSKNKLLIKYDDFAPGQNCTPTSTPTSTPPTSVAPTSVSKPPLSTSVLAFSASKAPHSKAAVAGTLPFTGPTAPVRSGLVTGLGLIAAGGALVMFAGRRRRNIGSHH